MVKLYADKIEAGRMTIEEVPNTWKQRVIDELARREAIRL